MAIAQLCACYVVSRIPLPIERVGGVFVLIAAVKTMATQTLCGRECIVESWWVMSLYCAVTTAVWLIN